MNSPAWEKIKKDPHYLNYFILDTESKYPKQRTRGQYFVLLVFFNHEIQDSALKIYHVEGRKYQHRESLDTFIDSPHRFYGTVKMLQFS